MSTTLAQRVAKWRTNLRTAIALVEALPEDSFDLTGWGRCLGSHIAASPYFAQQGVEQTDQGKPRVNLGKGYIYGSAVAARLFGPDAGGISGAFCGPGGYETDQVYKHSHKQMAIGRLNHQLMLTYLRYLP